MAVSPLLPGLRLRRDRAGRGPRGAAPGGNGAGRRDAADRTPRARRTPRATDTAPHPRPVAGPRRIRLGLSLRRCDERRGGRLDPGTARTAGELRAMRRGAHRCRICGRGARGRGTPGTPARCAPAAGRPAVSPRTRRGALRRRCRGDDRSIRRRGHLRSGAERSACRRGGSGGFRHDTTPRTRLPAAGAARAHVGAAVCSPAGGARVASIVATAAEGYTRANGAARNRCHAQSARVSGSAVATRADSRSGHPRRYFTAPLTMLFITFRWKIM